MPQRTHIDAEVCPADSSTGSWQLGQQRVLILIFTTGSHFMNIEKA